MNKLNKFIKKESRLSMVEIQTMPTKEIKGHILNIQKRCITIDTINEQLGRITSHSLVTPKIKTLLKKRY